jgi:hypothetical protein
MTEVAEMTDDQEYRLSMRLFFNGVSPDDEKAISEFLEWIRSRGQYCDVERISSDWNKLCFDNRGDSSPRFKVNNRVRVKFGADRGHYGVIVSSGGDDGTYYGVKLDCHDNPVGYSEYELDKA